MAVGGWGATAVGLRRRRWHPQGWVPTARRTGDVLLRAGQADRVGAAFGLQDGCDARLPVSGVAHAMKCADQTKPGHAAQPSADGDADGVQRTLHCTGRACSRVQPCPPHLDATHATIHIKSPKLHATSPHPPRVARGRLRTDLRNDTYRAGSRTGTGLVRTREACGRCDVHLFAQNRSRRRCRWALGAWGTGPAPGCFAAFVVRHPRQQGVIGRHHVSRSAHLAQDRSRPDETPRAAARRRTRRP